jgi:glycosyltransferase involved in cell wall biosynthesis
MTQLKTDRKLRVGVWLNENIKPEKGGAYSYYSQLVNGISKYNFKNAEIVFLSNKEIISESFQSKIIKNKSSKPTLVKKIIGKITKKKNNKLRDEIYQYADIVYYLTPECAHTDIPYIYTLWDLAHFNSYTFPEFSMDGNFEYRKKVHDFLPHKALAIFAESESGKKQCEKYLNINQERIKVVPLFPSGVVSPDCIPKKPEKMKGDEFFIHYSAQYWAHKNHYNLLEAMGIILKTFPKLKLVLTGSDKGNKEHIKKIITDLKLENSVIDLGFISIEELRWLYENSQGLVMPTLLGPTNMPPLEAATLGCPVACTDLPGHIEQVGDYGYYFNGIEPSDIADKTIAMINDKKNGIVRKYNNQFNINNTLAAIDEAFADIKQIRFCWGWDTK